MACGADADQDRIEGARRLIHNSPAPSAAVALAAVGEFVLTVQRDSTREEADEAIRQLMDAAQKGRIEFVAFGSDAKRMAEIVKALTDADEELDPTDALIAGSLILDPRADVLFTTDHVLLESTEVAKVFKAHHKAAREFTSVAYTAAKNRKKRF